VALGIVGDIKATLQALLPRLGTHENNPFLRHHVERHKKQVEAAKGETPHSPDAAISGTYLTQIINKQAAEDALFSADDGTAAVWMLRHIDTGGKRRTFASLLHGTMAGGMPSAIGLKKSLPDRQVVCLAGDGGFAMLLGDLMTLVQEKLPIKIAVYDNGKLGFVDIEQKAAGLIPVYTDLLNPDFGAVARAMGIWGHQVEKAGELDEAVGTWLAQPGPALLHVKVKPMQLVTPPSPFVSSEAVVGMAVYTARAILHGKGGDVWEMVTESI
jgi:pyruvate dehydrogenase (quinone)